MARQKGVLKFKGAMGGISFYRTQDGHFARTQGGVDGSRIANDPAFQRTRENGAEFGRAGKAGKLLRSAFRAALLNTADKRVVGRLTRDMLRVVKSDNVNERGKRVASAGNLLLLKNFDFNINAKLGTTFFAPFVPAVDRVAGSLAVSVEPFVPLNMIVAPSGTSHFRLTSGGAEMDFDNELFVNAYSDSGILPYNSLETALIELNNGVTADSPLPLLLVFGIEFFQEVNGEMYSLKNGAFNALSLVEVVPSP
ncbi:MAG: hypothetical protein V7724_18480 [Sediminicola sp.]